MFGRGLLSIHVEGICAVHNLLGCFFYSVFVRTRGGDRGGWLAKTCTTATMLTDLPAHVTAADEMCSLGMSKLPQVLQPSWGIGSERGALLRPSSVLADVVEPTSRVLGL